MYALKPLSLELWKCGNVPVENIHIAGMYIESPALSNEVGVSLGEKVICKRWHTHEVTYSQMCPCGQVTASGEDWI